YYIRWCLCTGGLWRGGGWRPDVRNAAGPFNDQRLFGLILFSDSVRRFRFLSACGSSGCFIPRSPHYNQGSFHRSVSMNIAKILTGMTLAAAVAVPVTAQEPTRGFMVERGSVAAQGAASVDLYTGGGYSGGAVRLGLGKGELVLNSGKVVSGLGINTSEAVFKLGLSNLNGMSEMKHSLAVYGGVSVLDVDGGASYTNLMVGAAFTADMNGLLLTAAPEFIIDDLADDNYLNV